MLLRRASLVSVILSGLLSISAPAALAQAPAPAASKPSIASFFEFPAFGNAVLSPSGRYLAVRSSAPDRHDFLAVIDLSNNKPTVAASFDDADVDAFQWVNDERLLFDLAEKKTGLGDLRHAPGLFAVNRDGGKLVQLADRSYQPTTKAEAGRQLLPWHTDMLRQRPRNSADTYVTSNEYTTTGELAYVDLIRVNTLTGQAHTVPRPRQATGWLLDQNGEPRIASQTDKGTTTLYYIDPATSEWRTIASFPAFTGGPNAIKPVAFGPDGTLYVSANHGKDTLSLYTLDIGTGKLSDQPVVTTAGYDFNGTLIIRGGKLLGVRLKTDATSDEWFSADMKSLQQKIDKALPTTVNMIDIPSAPATPWVMVRAYSDTTPLSYYLYNKENGQLSRIGSTRPAINPLQMGRQQAIRYKARDGLEIPALLTLPRGGGKNLPMVVLVHGGPWVDGPTWGWNKESQFLASRGYAVLEPAFRGTTGYGARHLLSSFKQWGLAMQNDVADGTRWAIAQGYADPKRICIAGASYGGYATLMGLVNDPDLYRCGVDWVGVTDINLMYSGGWSRSSDMSDQWKEYGMPQMIGDQVKDAAQLKATSPIEQASRITQPVLMAYGGADRRVPLYHGKKFYDAVTRTNKNVEWIEYPEEGHGWHLPKNAIDFWGRVETFLDKNIGKDAVIR
jgi:dipeptidyl aminopeptidase/acylaminoacyl peptidase